MMNCTMNKWFQLSYIQILCKKGDEKEAKKLLKEKIKEERRTERKFWVLRFI